ncbi:MAG: polymer-forming cytoskeletal protein [Nitrospirae bacterium]|nr:MAG: polymer-forming cytoskeletal protein [Nitrospirota bacterium]
MLFKRSLISKETSTLEDIVQTFLGQDVYIKGQARFIGSVRIDGRFEGDIVAEGTLIVGPHASIKGTVRTKVLIGGGRIEGTVITSHNIQLLKSAVLLGEVQTPNMSIEEGATFHGFCNMGAIDTTLESLAEPDREPLLSAPTTTK